MYRDLGWYGRGNSIRWMNVVEVYFEKLTKIDSSTFSLLPKSIHWVKRLHCICLSFLTNNKEWIILHKHNIARYCTSSLGILRRNINIPKLSTFSSSLFYAFPCHVLWIKNLGLISQSAIVVQKNELIDVIESRNK